MSASAAIGLRLHTGWAMLVAVAPESGSIRVVRRSRVVLFPPDRGRFVYHEAAELPLPDAGRLVDSARHAAEHAARSAMQSAIENLHVTRACMPTTSSSVPDDLAGVLRSHARIHAAEGALYAHAIASACESLGIPLTTVREREVFRLASAAVEISEAMLRARLDDIRKALGPPWTMDHKIAAAAALIQT